LTLEEIRGIVARAIETLDETGLYPEVRMNAAYGLLVQVASARHELPDTLRSRFEHLWAAYHRAEPRIGEILASRNRYSFYSSAEFQECERLTREFADAIDAELAARASIPDSLPADAPAEHETESPSDETNGRAAGD
jgi:hypothetical protein